jgi:hypothetical protein
VRWNKFVSDIFGDEVLSQGFRRFVVHDLELDEVAELGEPLVGAGICVNDSCFGSTGEELEMYITLACRPRGEYIVSRSLMWRETTQ